MQRRTLALSVILACVMASTSGCLIATPSPAVEMLQMTIATASGLVSLTPVSAQNVVAHKYPTPQSVCIEQNPNAPMPDLVSAIQMEIQAHRIESRVYGPGGAPSDCEATLNYSAIMAWDKPMFSDDYRNYMSEATLVLRASGKVLATASYQTRQWGSGKWSSTRSKIAPVVDALLTGKLK
ncbi:cell division protein FtsI [Uliginosibacterium gangwonense]|uniref:cell division protein FtsI n=1 Tax=Uliginosibacterium gangwonense TaxID=392736 RepID=UPI0012FC5B6E|nr:cell division protein FtsI [Uliginosibacterium gangwonense]